MKHALHLIGTTVCTAAVAALCLLCGARAWLGAAAAALTQTVALAAFGAAALPAESAPVTMTAQQAAASRSCTAQRGRSVPRGVMGPPGAFTASVSVPQSPPAVARSS